MLFIFIVSVLIGIVLIKWRYFIWRRNSFQFLPGNKPGFFNVFGDVGGFAIYNILYKRSTNKYDLHHKLIEMFHKNFESFRHHPLFCAWLATIPFVVLVKAEAVEQLLKNNKNINKSTFYKFLEPVMGMSVLTKPGDEWKSRRRLLNPCFHPDILRGFMDVFNERSQELVNLFRDETTKEFTYISTPITLCALDIVCETMLGVAPGALQNNNSEYVRCLKSGLEKVTVRVGAFWQWSDFVFGLTKSGREFRDNAKVIKNFTRSVIRERKRLFLSKGKGCAEGKRKVLLDMLLELHLEKKELSEEDMCQEVDTMILAGHETTGVSVAWALYLIGLHPDIQTKILEELDRIFGDDVKSPITEKDIHELSYLDCVLKETLRLYPGISLFARQSKEDIKICGYEIPKDTHIALLPYFLHRDPKVFPDPEKFDPERFFPENCVNRNPYAYIPFSAGPRNCIGQKFAVTEIKTILASILRNYTIESLDEREKVLPVIHIVLLPSSPIRIRIRCRRNENLQTSGSLKSFNI